MKENIRIPRLTKLIIIFNILIALLPGIMILLYTTLPNINFEPVIPTFIELSTLIFTISTSIITIKILSKNIFDKKTKSTKNNNNGWSQILDEKLDTTINAKTIIENNSTNVRREKSTSKIEDKKNRELSDYLDDYINESSEISERIYDSSKNYLFTGLVVAFLGLIIFVLLGLFINPSVENKHILDKLLGYLPRFGTLFFVEFIAFFFLKQYRILLEEYRYYESIKRDRQHKKIILEIVNQYRSEPDCMKLIIDYMSKHSVHVQEITGNHKVELEKALYKDMDILDKLVEFSKVIKK